MSTNVGEIDLSLVLNSDKFKSQLKSVDSQADTASSKISSYLSKIGTAVLTAFSVTAIVKFGKACLDVASETSNAWIGLNSILTGQGKSFDRAKQFINDYVSDGLVPLNNAIASYKNLALRGYSSEQIQKTMNALKNSATFARQSTYSLGDAVQTATEGLKNENSVIVDNAGVTKNVAKMWEDYAKSIGKTRDSLTQTEKIQAEVNGILEETKFQSNDAAIYTNTYSGKLAQLNSAFTNMKTAIGNVLQPLAKMFVPAITIAINAVTKLFNSFASLLALFGLKTDSIENVSSGIGDIASSAKDASNAIDGVGDSAKDTSKKANGLASFDNLNVLKDDNSSNTSSSGSSSGTGTSVGLDLTDTTKAIAETSKLFNNIDFTPLINSFNKVKEAAEPLISTVKNGLKWLYDNVLVPLAKWTIEDLLPAFLNLIAGALKVLNPLLTAFQPIFQWFWDYFLKPIAQWTGGVIVSVLNTLADVLSKIGDWMTNNQSIVTKMEIAVLGFFGAWKLTELMAFIQMSGGIVGALTAITTAIKSVIIAKVADKAETIALTVMYAKDFVVSLASGTAALIKQAAQWVINTAMKVADTVATIASTAATTAATVATWLFNAALAVLTSPITLVVVAIGALIAIIVLLVKNWDKVSAALSAGWEWIKQKAIEVFSAIGNFLSDLWQSIKDTINIIWTAIKDFFINLWNSIKTAVSNAVLGIYNGIVEKFNAVKDFISLVFNAIKEFFTNIWNGIKNIIIHVINYIRSSITNVFNSIKDIITNIFNSVKDIVTNIWNNIINVISKVINNVKDTISNVINVIKSIWESIWNIVSNVVSNTWNGIINVISRVINNIKYTISNILNGIKSIWENIWTSLTKTISNVWNTIIKNVKEGVSGAWNAITSVFGNIGNWFKDKFSQAWQAVKNVFSAGGKIFDGIKDGILNGLKSIVNAIIAGINKVIKVPFDGLNSALRSIKGVNIMGLKPFDWIKTIGVPQIPMLAQGGYVKANTPQLAMIGDNKHQGEVVAPEDKMLDMILTALKMFKDQESSQINNSQANTVTINFAGSLAQLIRVLKPELDRESKRRGDKLVLGGVI